ncbi:MAG: hypothetical protein IAG13_23475 [Deltaproteobacteria bacterium]|nr:hypothetical protein [Nannocystaceae bacterium]
MAKARRAIAKSDFVEKNLAAALERLAVAAAAGERATAARGKEGKQLAITVKRLSKKRASQAKRRLGASKRARKSPSGDTRKALRTAVRELAGTTKALSKAKALKAAHATEYAALRIASRRASGYAKAIAQIDRALGRSAD